MSLGSDLKYNIVQPYPPCSQTQNGHLRSIVECNRRYHVGSSVTVPARVDNKRPLVRVLRWWARIMGSCLRFKPVGEVELMCRAKVCLGLIGRICMAGRDPHGRRLERPHGQGGSSGKTQQADTSGRKGVKSVLGFQWKRKRTAFIHP